MSACSEVKTGWLGPFNGSEVPGASQLFMDLIGLRETGQPIFTILLLCQLGISYRADSCNFEKPPLYPDGTSVRFSPPLGDIKASCTDGQLRLDWNVSRTLPMRFQLRCSSGAGCPQQIGHWVTVDPRISLA